jgi:hypothetical protein
MINIGKKPTIKDGGIKEHIPSRTTYFAPRKFIETNTTYTLS